MIAYSKLQARVAKKYKLKLAKKHAASLVLQTSDSKKKDTSEQQDIVTEPRPETNDLCSPGTSLSLCQGSTSEEDSSTCLTEAEDEEPLKDILPDNLASKYFLCLLMLWHATKKCKLTTGILAPP